MHKNDASYMRRGCTLCRVVIGPVVEPLAVQAIQPMFTRQCYICKDEMMFDSTDQMCGGLVCANE
jgi:hypothetical protein